LINVKTKGPSRWKLAAVSGIPLANRREARELCLLRQQSSETSPHSGREGETLTALQAEGATQAPVICSEAEREQQDRIKD